MQPSFEPVGPTSVGSSRVLVRLSAGLTLLMVLSSCRGEDEPRPTRIVLITVDTLRYDSFDPQGRETDMPATQAFARRGQVFERFFATTSTTQPTHASLFTGLHPWQHGVTRNGIVLSESETTLAEHLKQERFSTAAVVASFPLHSKFGFGQGFDEFHDTFQAPYMDVWGGIDVEGGRFYSLAEAVTTSALAVLDRSVGSRQFFWFHYFDAHDPYGDSGDQVVSLGRLLTMARRADPDIEQKLVTARKLYRSDVRAIDRSLKRLFDRLDAETDKFDTHVILTSDHGESLGEHGCLGHGKRVRREQVHVPLIVVSPKLTPGRRRELASSVDLPRTILSLADLGTGPFGGQDLTRPYESSAASVFGMRSAFARGKTEQMVDGTVRELRPRCFFTVVGDTLYSGDSELVLEEDDPVRRLEGEKAEELRALFAKFEKLHAAIKSDELLESATQDALRKLGY